MALTFGSGGVSDASTGLLGMGLGLASQFGNGRMAPGATQQYTNQATNIPAWMQNQWQNAFNFQNAAANRTTNQAIAGWSPAQQMAMSGITGSVGYGMNDLQNAQNQVQGLSQGVGQPQIQNFFNPYQQSAIQGTLGTMEQQRQQQDAAINSQANAAGAWGGDRSAVANSLNDQSWNLAEANTIGNMENQGYQNAVNSAFTNQAQQLQGNSQLQNAITNRIAANTQQYQNALGVGNQQQAQQQAYNNWAIQRAQLAGMNLNPNVGKTTIGNINNGTIQNPITGALAGLSAGGQIANQLGGMMGYANNGLNYGNATLPSGQTFSSYDNMNAYNDMTDPGMSDVYSQYGSAPDWGIEGGTFSAAGGEAANGVQALTADQLSNPGMSDVQNMTYESPSYSSPTFTGSTLGSALGAAGAGLGLVSGLQRGGVSGYASAALNAARIGNMTGATDIPGVGAAGSVLGLYNGIRQGGVVGDTNAALSAATLAGDAGSAAGVSSLATIGAYAGPIGLALAPVLFGMSQPAYTLSGDYYNRMKGYIAAGPGQFAASGGYNGNYWDPQYMNYAAAQQALTGTDWSSLVKSGAVPFSPKVLEGHTGPQGVGNK